MSDFVTVGATLLVVIASALGVRTTTAKRVFSSILAFFGFISERFSRRAVRLRVETEINEARQRLLQDAPEVMSAPLRLEFARAKEAAVVAKAGEMVVVMKPYARHEQNVTHALMAYLPRAVLPIARPYLASDTVRALDFTLAKAVLSSATLSRARDYLNERLVEPARRGSRRLADQLATMDAIDLHGWLTRVLIAEYKRLGDLMYPGAQDERFTIESDEFAQWLYRVAQPNTEGSLQYRGRFFRVAIIFVAAARKLETEGLAPYRSRAVYLLYNQNFHIVHMMGRDANITAARAVADLLEEQGLIAKPTIYEYDLREDFAMKRLARKRAVCITLRRNPERDASEGEGDLPSDTFAPPDRVVSSPTPAMFPFHVEQGTICELERVRGFGFIQTPDASKVFFHSSQIVDCSFEDLRIGQQVLYRKIFDPKRNKHHAETVKALPPSAGTTKPTRTK